EGLDRPLLSTTLPGEMIEDFTDPELIYEHFENMVDAVIDGGIGGFVPSTVVDCTTDDWSVIREGAGVWEG
ncbi:MAG TPA: Sua5/YciO/YrdC/YwlC family protein, partial [Ginsengibacter sp.]|nr:Sua5/YciO/YrdC/YwlC family protein [Ginsengibacter sp.]